MKYRQNPKRIREWAVLIALCALFGVAIFVFLFLMGREIFIVLLGTVVVIGLVAGLHYLVWGRRTLRKQYKHEVEEKGLDEAMSLRNGEEDRAVVRQSGNVQDTESAVKH